MTEVFLDTGYLVALESAGDQHHAAATEHWRELSRSRPRLLTTSFVLDEVITFFVSRGRHSKAVEIGSRLLASPSVRFVHVDEELFRAAFEYLKQRSDKLFSLTDCASFVLMERLGIRDALAFDSHFEQAGFARIPGARG
jgi:predicted nucleic acid-binding protein